MDPKLTIENESIFRGIKVFGKSGYFDVTLSDGKFKSIVKSKKSKKGIIIPKLCDIHVHLDKTGTHKRINKKAKSLFEAIELMDKDKLIWSENDIYERANNAIQNAWENGTGFIRTHIDWIEEKTPIAWNVIKSLKKKWQDKVAIEMASLSPLDLLSLEGEKIGKIVSEDNSIFGAFVYRNENLQDKIKLVFEIANKFGLKLDFHVDEGLDKDANGIDYIIKYTKKFKMENRVLCSHACSLSIRDEKEAMEILEDASSAGIGLTCLPSTNLWLQDFSENRTPRFRGIAPIIEAKNLGIPVMIASDNCQDSFYPYGNHDLLSVFKLALISGHLDENNWFDSITHLPSEWMGFNNKIQEGSEASFLKFNQSSISEIMTLSKNHFQIWEKGKLIRE